MTAANAPRVVVLGGLNLDFVFRAARLPRAGETVVGDRFTTTRGGKAGNQAVAAARLLPGRGRVAMVGRVGDDWMGEQLLAGLDAEGVDRSAVQRDPQAASGVAAIHVDADGENTVTAVYGANARCDARQTETAIALLHDAAVLLLQLETPWAASAPVAAAARARGVRVILDPAPIVPLPDDAFRHVDILTPNQGEAERWSGLAVTDAASAAGAAARLRDLGPRVVIVTLGVDGVYVLSDDPEANGHQPGFTVETISTLAAGDAFNGALAAGLAEALPLGPAVRRAQAAAALATTSEGAQEAMPRRSQVEALL